MDLDPSIFMAGAGQASLSECVVKATDVMAFRDQIMGFGVKAILAGMVIGLAFGLWIGWELRQRV